MDTHAFVCFWSGADFHSLGLAPLRKKSLNTTAYDGILDDSVIPTLWTWLSYSVEEPFCLTQNFNLNAIKHVWDELEHRLRARPYRSG